MQPENPAIETVWIGIDVSKKSVDAAIHSPARSIPPASFERTAAGMAALAAWAQAHAPQGARLRAVLEATGRYSTEAIAWLLECAPALAPACVNPLHAKRFAQSLGLRNKTDRLDARMLARFGAERSPVPYEAPRAAVAELRALVRERRERVGEQTRMKNRMSEGSESRFLLRDRERELKRIGKAIARIDEEIECVLARDEALRRDAALLLSIPGVGRITAVTVLAELGDLRRFASGRQLAAFAGLSPRRFESGSSVRGRTRMCKQGNPSVRAILYMSALSASRMEKGMKPIYKRLIDNGKHPMAALGAIMRRQLLLMRAVIVSGKSFEQPGKKSPVTEQKAVA